AIPTAAAQPNRADVTGAWAVDLNPDFGGHQDTITCTFRQEGRNVSGECGHGAPEPQAPLSGEVNGETLTFRFKTGRNKDQTATFSAMLANSGTTMKGSWRFVDDQGQAHEGGFSGRKQR